MKIFFVLVFFVFALSSCSPEKNVRISGNLNDSNLEKIYLHELGSSRSDTAQLDTKGYFVFKRKISQPTFYSLTVNGKAISLLAHPGEKIVISGDAQNLPPSYSVDGSEDSRHIRRLSQRLEQTVFLRDSLIRTLRIYEGNRNFVNIQRQFNWTFENELDSLRVFNIQFMEENPRSLAVIYALYQQVAPNVPVFNQEEDLQYFLRADSMFYRRFPRVPYVNTLRTDVAGKNEQFHARRLNRMLYMLGDEAPEIALSAPDGNIVKLSSTRGKFVLIDFWASWSAPCRTENINLLNVYNKYRDKGFEIYQVSLDQSKTMWERAIEEDGLTWINVSDFKYWDSETVALYGVESIPANFLLDREGSIMTKNLTADALDQRLSEFFAAIE